MYLELQSSKLQQHLFCFAVSSVAWHGVSKQVCNLDSARAWSTSRFFGAHVTVHPRSSLSKAQAPKICKSWHQDLGAMFANVDLHNQSYPAEATTSLGHEICPTRCRWDKLAASENRKQFVSWPAGFVPKVTPPNICYNALPNTPLH